MTRLLLLACLLCGGCARCPMRMFDCVERACLQCGESFVEWDGTHWHKCRSELR